MSIERSTAGTGIGAEPAPTPAPGEIGAGTPLALQLQVLSTEHWSLLASRSLAWNESFSRAGMFLSTLSGAIVALALVAQASDFGDGFRIFALVILPVVLFIGLTTLLRLGIANYHDGLTVVGMNRIRAAYFERVPEVRRYFVTGGTDDDDADVARDGHGPRAPDAVHTARIGANARRRDQRGHRQRRSAPSPRFSSEPTPRSRSIVAARRLHRRLRARSVVRRSRGVAAASGVRTDVPRGVPRGRRLALVGARAHGVIPVYAAAYDISMLAGRSSGARSRRTSTT